ncbi:MAG TPA: response regulator transcription factor [Thermodesulfobacteriota bacterium]|nr:response regulator transcription factor [Thermodesulfobacteriota bacterium]
MPENKQIRVFIIGDKRLFNEVFAATLRNQQGIALVGSTINPGEALERVQSLLADIVLVDATLKRTVVVQVIQSIKTEIPDTRVILLGLNNREEDNLEFIEAGASGYILKQESIPELLQTVELVCSGQTKCSTKMAALVFGKIAELSRECSQEMPWEEELTQREEEILQLIVKGLSNKEIAVRLRVSLYTVKNHVHSVLEKLRVSSRIDVIERLQDFEKGRGVKKLSLVDRPSDETSSE